ncbi:MAG: YceI family protein [Bacteroidota bacterium]
MKKIALILAALVMGLSSYAQSTWAIDGSHSTVGFSIVHLVITEVNGTFGKYDGKLVTSKDDFSDASIDFKIDVASISTGNGQRDGHLKSGDFFDAEKFPSITFKGKSLTKVEGNKYKLVGDLTMKGVTKEVTLDTKYTGTVVGAYGKTRAGFKITGELDRFDYGLKWDAATEAGNLVVSKEVELDINIQLVKQ